MGSGWTSMGEEIGAIQDENRRVKNIPDKTAIIL
jgi:hypothetical protein